MTGGGRDYMAYLLRLWRTGLGENAAWHASLQDARTGERMGFACLDDLVAYLKQRMGEGEARLGHGTERACARQGPPDSQALSRQRKEAGAR
jgi:hypothetical protein